MRAKSVIIILLFSISLIAGCSDHSVKIKVEPSRITVGENGKIIIKLKARGKWHINADSLVMIKFIPSEGVVLGKDELTQEDRIPEHTFIADFKVTNKAQIGKTALTAKIFFIMCTETGCRVIDEEHIIPLYIK